MKYLFILGLSFLLTTEFAYSASTQTPSCQQVILDSKQLTFEEVRAKYAEPYNIELLYQQMISYNGKLPQVFSSQEFMQDRPLRRQTAEDQDRRRGVYSALNRSYEALLGRQFFEDLMSLNSKQWWLDAGAGHLSAVYEYQAIKSDNKEKSANTIAVAPTRDYNTDYSLQEIQRKLDKQKSKSRILFFGKYIEDLAPQEIAKVDLISDVQGAFAYSSRPDLILIRYAQYLKTGGRAYVLFPGVGNLGIKHVTTVVPPPQERITVVDLENYIAFYYPEFRQWLSSIEGVKINFSENAMILERTEGPIRFAPLSAERYYSTLPPYRTFTWDPSDIVTLSSPTNESPKEKSNRVANYYEKLKNLFRRDPK